MLLVLLVVVLGNSATTTKLQTPRTIAISGGATGTATSFDGTGNISIPVTSLDATKLSGTAKIATTGNAGTATKLATERKINGTNFDGTENITTSKWGTARTISLSGAVSGSASVDGSENVTITTTQANIAVLTGTIKEDITINYPSGYNKNNCIVISAMMKMTNTDARYGYGSVFNSSIYASGGVPIRVSLGDSNIQLSAKKILLSSENVEYASLEAEMNYKIVLMKVS